MAPAEGERRLTSAMRWSPGSASATRRPGAAPGPRRPRARSPARAERVELRDDLGPAPRRDLRDDARAGMPGPRPRPRRRSRPAAGRLLRPAPRAAAACRRGRLSSAPPLRAQLPEQLDRRAPRRRPGPPCPPRPPARRPRPRPASAAPALSSTTSRRAPGSPRSTPSTSVALCGGIAAAQGRVVARAQPHASGARISWRSMPARGHVVEHARAVERQLVHPVAVDHEGSLRAQPPRHLGDRGAGRVPHADQRAGRAGRVGERAQQVERGPHADLPARRARVAHRRVERRREQEREAELADRRARPTRRRGRSGRPARRARRPSPTFEVIARLPCLATGTPERRHDQRRGGRDVEGPGAVAAGARRRRSSPPAPPPAPRARASRTRSPPARPRSRRASGGPSAAPPAATASPRRPSPRPSPGARRPCDSDLPVDDRRDRGPDQLAHRAASAASSPSHRRVELPSGASDAARRERSRRRVEPPRLPLPGEPEEVGEQVRPVGREHGLRVELDALDGQESGGAGPSPRRPRGWWRSRTAPRGASPGRRTGSGSGPPGSPAACPRGGPSPSWSTVAGLAVDEGRRADDRGAAGGPHRLHAEAHAEQRDRAARAATSIVSTLHARRVRVAGPGRDHDAAQVLAGIVGHAPRPRPA